MENQLSTIPVTKNRPGISTAGGGVIQTNVGSSLTKRPLAPTF